MFRLVFKIAARQHLVVDHVFAHELPKNDGHHLGRLPWAPAHIPYGRFVTGEGLSRKHECPTCQVGG